MNRGSTALHYTSTIIYILSAPSLYCLTSSQFIALRQPSTTFTPAIPSSQCPKLIKLVVPQTKQALTNTKPALFHIKPELPLQIPGTGL